MTISRRKRLRSIPEALYFFQPDPYHEGSSEPEAPMHRDTGRRRGQYHRLLQTALGLGILRRTMNWFTWRQKPLRKRLLSSRWKTAQRLRIRATPAVSTQTAPTSIIPRAVSRFLRIEFLKGGVDCRLCLRKHRGIIRRRYRKIWSFT